MPIRRTIDAIFWFATGTIAILGAATQSDLPAYTWLIGIACCIYGIYIGATRRSYWVHTYMYAAPIIIVVVLIAKAKS